MQLKVYAIYDKVAQDFPFIFEATNDEVMKRNVKGALTLKEQNVMNTNIPDKSIYHIGTRETSGEGVLVGELKPLFVCSLAELRLELINEIKRAKAEMGDENPTAEEVVSDGQ